MDIVSQLIEENVRRAQNINTTVLHKNNKYSENIIKSFSSFYSRIKNWFYYEDSIIPKDHKKENTNIEKIDLEELKEISINIQNLLEKQNKELEELNLDVLNENIIIKMILLMKMQVLK